jgi:hypothetical protein
MPAERRNPVSTGNTPCTRSPTKYEERSAAEMTIAAAPVVSKPTEMPEMMLVAGPVRDASMMSFTGR